MNASSSLTRKRIEARGVVQGVGFRPFVYNLARGLGLCGFVMNSSAGVMIEIEGSEAELQDFLDTLQQHPPPLAHIDRIDISDVDVRGDSLFSIGKSLAIAGEFALVSPDVGTCEDCWHDFSDPANRRYGYAFTNCTNCGPRYTIVKDVPYDRTATTMAAFRMCPTCQAEYDDPANRRFHAQPNACGVCGPQLSLMRAGKHSA